MEFLLSLFGAILLLAMERRKTPVLTSIPQRSNAARVSNIIRYLLQANYWEFTICFAKRATETITIDRKLLGR